MRLLILALVSLFVQRNMILGSGVTNIPNADFVQPVECSQSCELTLGAVKYVGPNTSFTTRAYNGNIPGPTLRVTPGSSLFVNLKNELEDIDNYALVNGTGGEAGDANSAQLLNTTNLHTHGLHISPKAPGDDVKASISPGESRFYDFKVMSIKNYRSETMPFQLSNNDLRYQNFTWEEPFGTTLIFTAQLVIPCPMWLSITL